jgi:hypothetical protein
MPHTRTYPTIALAAVVTASLAGCGGSGSSERPAAGSPQNPMVAQVPAQGAEGTTPPRSQSGTHGPSTTRTPSAPAGKVVPSGGKAKPATTVPGEPGSANAPGYQSLVEHQSSHPKTGFSPCNLVSEAQAAAIVGAKMQQPIEAPQGPTCIYRSRSGAHFVALAVQTTNFTQLKRAMRGRQQISVASRTGICGRVGQSTLYLPLAGTRVLSVTAPCDVAKSFALKALPHL